MMNSAEDTDCITESDKESFLTLNSLIRNGDIQGVKELIGKDKVNVGNYTQLISAPSTDNPPHPVCLAAKTGNVEIMDYLISIGFDPEEPDNDESCYPIHHACEHGKLDVLKSLVLKHEVDIEAFNYTPLFVAIDSHELDIVKFLVENGAYVNYREEINRITALHKAARNQPDICDYLISEGANVNAEDFSSITPLHCAIYQNNVETARVILDGGADVNFAGERDPPFLAATEHGHLNLVKLLYSRDADPEIPENNSPLHAAMSPKLYDIARYLVVDIGVRLNNQNYSGDTPFSLAVKEDSRRAAQLLIKAGYDAGKESCLYDDESLAKILRNQDGEEFVKYLRQTATNPRPLQDLCCFQIRRLLGQGVSSAVDELPLPEKIKDIVMLRHL